ncbi:MAG: hypothetical protein BIFFINMI_01118 [Phycisphaerae bacterium]|nr:hypothetical protein [Phycisphaerae bacterium]
MLDNARVRLASLGPLVLRLGLGLGFLLHGWGKFSTLIDGQELAMTANMWWPTGLAWAIASTEFIGGLCLIVGLLTRFWAAGQVIAMTVALCKFHITPLEETCSRLGEVFRSLFEGNGDAMRTSLEQTAMAFGGIQTPLLFGVIALALFLMGPGCWSIDHLVGLIFRGRKANAVVGMGMRFPAREGDDDAPPAPPA